jgi:hypothetical protein
LNGIESICKVFDGKPGYRFGKAGLRVRHQGWAPIIVAVPGLGPLCWMGLVYIRIIKPAKRMGEGPNNQRVRSSTKSDTHYGPSSGIAKSVVLGAEFITLLVGIGS